MCVPLQARFQAALLQALSLLLGVSEATIGDEGSAPLENVPFIYFIYLLYDHFHLEKKKREGRFPLPKKSFKILKPLFYMISCQQRAFSREA